MKKFIMFLCFAVFIIPTYAVDMCVSDDTFAVVLDPGVATSNSSYDNAKFEWRVEADYGTIIGISACINRGGVNRYNIYSGILTDGLTGVEAFGGEKAGSYCFCKITHPVVSLWGHVCSNTQCGNTTSSTCANGCPKTCADAVRDNTEKFRAKLFGSVTN